jgi:glyoxylase-like metal-dependent hydrolase (beta-lactamase superfamily II)
MLEIYEIPVTPFMQNCTLLVCSETKDAAVCDCGDAGPVLQKIEQLGVKVTKVIATHGHLDHIGGTADLMQALQIPFWFPRGDDFLREGLVEQARMYGFPPVQVPSVDVDIVAGMDLMIGN